MPATAEDVENYARYIGDPDFPVFADGEGIIKGSTPLTQTQRPEVCALSPEMAIIDCAAGHGTEENMLDAIRDHAGL